MRDIRYAIRAFRQQPIFTVVAVATLALGIGANTAIFSVVYQSLLRPLAFPHGDRLASIYNVYLKAGGEPSSVAIPDYLDRRAGVPAIEDATLYTPRQIALTAGGPPEQITALAVTPSFFTTLERGPAIGRAFTDADVAGGAAARVVILTDGLWRSHFAADPAIVGRAIRVGGERQTVVGVLPADFELPCARRRAPAALRVHAGADVRRRARLEFSFMIARLRPGATIAQLDAQMDAVNAAVMARVPQRAEYMRTSGFTGRAEMWQAARGRELRTPLRDAPGRRGCRAPHRLRERRQPAPDAHRRTSPRAGDSGGNRRRPRAHCAPVTRGRRCCGRCRRDVRCRHRAGGYAAASFASPPSSCRFPCRRTSTGTRSPSLEPRCCLPDSSVASSPAVSILQTPSAVLLKDDSARATGGRRAAATRRTLVAAEAAMALVLLVTAGLLLKSLQVLSHSDPGFTAEGVLTAQVALPESRYPDADRPRAFWLGFARRCGHSPGGSLGARVHRSAQRGSERRLFRHGRTVRRSAPGQQTPHAFQDFVLGDYFRAMHIPLVAGRVFTDGDSATAPRVAIVDERLAARQFGGRTARSGRQLNFGSPRNYTIVGVVGTVDGRRPRATIRRRAAST